MQFWRVADSWTKSYAGVFWKHDRETEYKKKHVNLWDLNLDQNTHNQQEI